MLQNGARFVLALLLTLTFSPALAFADDGASSEGSGNPLEDLFYMVVGSDDAGTEVSTQEASANLFPSSLAAPPASTTLPELASASDLVNGGILLGSHGNLYYLREATFVNNGSANVFAYRTLERYDINSGSWSSLASLPTWLELCSATVFDGAIIVCGATMDNADGVPVHSASPEERVYSYDPSASNASWAELSSAGVPVGAGIVNNGGTLDIVGGVGNGLLSDVYSYETSTGIDEKVGSLSAGVAAPKLTVNDSTIYVYSYGSSLEELRAGTGSPRLQTIKNKKARDITGSLPALAAVADGSGYPSSRSTMFGSISTAVDGMPLVGPLGSGENADTYLMDWDGGFATYDQRVSDMRLFGAASCDYLGNLYGLGSVLNESGQPSFVFRSTEMVDADAIDGGSGVWRQGSKHSLDLSFTPDYGRFSHKVDVDGKKVIEGSEFESSVGSTVIMLKPEYLGKLSKGRHTLTAYFDDELTQVSTPFYVEVPATPLEEGQSAAGYTTPTSVAMTSDGIPAIPIAICSVAALVVALIAFRRVSSSHR